MLLKSILPSLIILSTAGCVSSDQAFVRGGQFSQYTCSMHGVTPVLKKILLLTESLDRYLKMETVAAAVGRSQGSCVVDADIDFLIGLLSYHERFVRMFAAAMLANTGERGIRALPTIRQVYRDAEPEIRQRNCESHTGVDWFGSFEAALQQMGDTVPDLSCPQSQQR